jgi:nickel-dependent lactate racemase
VNIVTKIKVPYGKTYQEADLPDAVKVEIVDPPCKIVDVKVENMIEEALEHPVGSRKLEEIARGRKKVLIIVNDQTRPGPNRQILEGILKRLHKAGVSNEQVSILIATGSHRAPTHEELETIMGKELAETLPVYIHDCYKNNVKVGVSSDNMPVYIDKRAVESDCVITTGLIAPHKAAGFSGGRKSIVPGIAGMETLKIHHSLPIRPFEPAMGWYETNPFHLAALHAAQFAHVAFIVNAVQDPHKQIVAVVAGDMDLAHQAGVKICREHNTVLCDKRADCIITSPGGSPRDCNLYQSQKALATAEMFADKDKDVTFILVAQAEDGIGPDNFQEWLRTARTPDKVIERFKREGFSAGTQKAFEYARALKKGRVIIVSDKLKENEVRSIKLDWAGSLQDAVNQVLERSQPEQVIVLPRAVSIIPEFRN